MDKTTAPPIRSLLFVPGSDSDQLAVADTLGADALVLDIEEPRTPFPEAERVRTRREVGAFLERQTGSGGPLCFVRIQSMSSGCSMRDLDAVVVPGLTGVLLPKLAGPGDIVALDAMLTCYETDRDLPRNSIVIYPVLETAQSIREAYEIGMASPRVAYLGGAISRFGDIHQALGFRWTAEGTETLYLREKVLVDARAAGVRWPISGMWGGRLDDHDGLTTWCDHLRDLGYFGMMITRPYQIEFAHRAFTPTPEEIAFWTDLVALADGAEGMDGPGIRFGEPGQGEVHVVHQAHVGSARKNLIWARELGLIDSAS